MERGALLQLTTLEWKREGGGRRSVGRESEMGELQISFLSITKEERMEGRMEGNGMGDRLPLQQTRARAAQSNDSGSARVGRRRRCGIFLLSPPLPISGIARRTAKGSKTAREHVERIS